MMNCFICPVCGEKLNEEEKMYRCQSGHCFDKSKFDYVNLLMSQKSSAKRHGDDRLMVRARRDFLSENYYGFLRDSLCEICGKYFENSSFILDAGCGECWYSSGILEYLMSRNINANIIGIDISKDALEFASKRKSGIKTAVASLFAIPLADESCNGILNIFSPEAFSEFSRVLKKGGILIRVIPLENHLLNLKAAIYDKPYLNEIPNSHIDGFELIEERELRETITLKSHEDLMSLFMMTPYYYKTGKSDQQKLESLESFETQAEFGIRIYKKNTGEREWKDSLITDLQPKSPTIS